MTSLYEPIKTALVTHFNIPEDSVRADSTLEDLGMDSLAVVELMCVLQDELGLRVPSSDDALKSLRATFGEAVTAVEQAQEPAPTHSPGPAAAAPVTPA
ncbi:acyl carrier protein [Streptomyces sp. NPDC004082]|uniref:acyl carrier protein n=1 Tax=unclassified Streptomyces TaxID=2593676 RepID=UPI0033A738E9